MKTIKIFLASSGELEEERKEIALFIAQENKKLVQQDIFLELIVWEELLQSLRGERIQNYFNKEMIKCDIIIVLFYKKIGQFTKEEFDIAYRNLKKFEKKPHYMFVFFKESKINIADINTEILEVNKLKKIIEHHEQIYNTFENKDSLINKIKRQFDLVIETKNIMYNAVISDTIKISDDKKSSVIGKKSNIEVSGRSLFLYGMTSLILTLMLSISITLLSNKKKYQQIITHRADAIISEDSDITESVNNINISNEISNTSDRVKRIQKRLCDLQSINPFINELIQKAKDNLYANNINKAESILTTIVSTQFRIGSIQKRLCNFHSLDPVINKDIQEVRKALYDRNLDNAEDFLQKIEEKKEDRRVSIQKRLYSLHSQDSVINDLIQKAKYALNAKEIDEAENILIAIDSKQADPLEILHIQNRIVALRTYICEKICTLQIKELFINDLELIEEVKDAVYAGKILEAENILVSLEIKSSDYERIVDIQKRIVSIQKSLSDLQLQDPVINVYIQESKKTLYNRKLLEAEKILTAIETKLID